MSTIAIVAAREDSRKSWWLRKQAMHSRESASPIKCTTKQEQAPLRMTLFGSRSETFQLWRFSDPRGVFRKLALPLCFEIHPRGDQSLKYRKESRRKNRYPNDTLVKVRRLTSNPEQGFEPSSLQAKHIRQRSPSPLPHIRMPRLPPSHTPHAKPNRIVSTEVPQREDLQ